MDTFLTNVVLGREVRAWVTAAIILVGGIVVAFLVRTIAGSILRRHIEQQSERDARSEVFGLKMVNSFVFPALLLGTIYGTLQVIRLEGPAFTVTNGIMVVLFSLVVIRFVVSVVNAFFARATDREGALDISRYKPLRSLSVFVIWIAGFLFLLDNLGMNVTAVVAGLGIGGIAVALAAQAVLADLFSYFVILFDRPFELGDFLSCGDILGSVEKIGVKSTKLRAVTGEQISMSNSTLTGKNIRNYGRMHKRLVISHTRVAYDTPAEKLRGIPEMMKEIINGREMAAFSRSHFSRYDEWSLVFETVYTVASPDYNLHMDIQQDINLGILERFQAEGIRFGVPSQTVTLEKEPSDAARQEST